MEPQTILVLALGLVFLLVAWRVLRRLEALGTDLERLDDIEDLYQRLDDLTEQVEQRRLGETLQAKLTEFTEGMARLSSAVSELQQKVGRAPAAAPAEAAAPDLAGIVRRHLEREGFETVRVLSEQGEAGGGQGRVTFEARRRGVTHKGHAVVEDGAVVDQALRSAYSTFP